MASSDSRWGVVGSPTNSTYTSSQDNNSNNTNNSNSPIRLPSCIPSSCLNASPTLSPTRLSRIPLQHHPSHSTPMSTTNRLAIAGSHQSLFNDTPGGSLVSPINNRRISSHMSSHSFASATYLPSIGSPTNQSALLSLSSGLPSPSMASNSSMARSSLTTTSFASTTTTSSQQLLSPSSSSMSPTIRQKQTSLEGGRFRNCQSTEYSSQGGQELEKPSRMTASSTRHLGSQMSLDLGTGIPNYTRTRRTAVSSESVAPSQLTCWVPPQYPKAPEESARLEQVVKTKLAVIFGGLKEKSDQVVSAMQKRVVSKGTVLIKQGEEGDNFYLVDSGKFDICVSRGGGPSTKVMEAVPGDSFGELALMYGAPRAATCIAREDCVVWALDRQSFRNLLVSSEGSKKKTYEGFLENISIFKYLTKYEKCQLSDILNVQECVDGECVVRQGDSGHRFYIVESGDLICKMSPGTGAREVDVRRYGAGQYFGELALIKHGRRKASIYAIGNNTRLLWIGKERFDRVLGPIINILEKNAASYPTYAHLMRQP